MLQLRVHADIQWYLDALHCMVLLHPPAMRPKHTGRNRLACGGQSFECVGWSEVTSGGVETPTTMSCWLHGNWIKVLIYPYDVLGGSEKLFTYLGAFAPVGCVIRGNCHLHTSGVKINQLAMFTLHIRSATANECLHLTLQRQSTASHPAPLVVQSVRSRGWHWVNPCGHGIQPSLQGDLWDQQHQSSKPHEPFQSTDNIIQIS